jgi:3'-phosphoadenosine 5'-phosphosulfate sulfotransferase (PAPS reductase)/FAD synthetase
MYLPIPLFPEYRSAKELELQSVIEAKAAARPALPEPTLEELLSYDFIIIGFSGGKDSVASFLRCLEMGVPLEKIELWHHIVDGREGSKLMDWPVTNSYCRAFAEHFGVPIYYTWKHGGFEGEMLRENALTQPVSFEAPQPDGSIKVITSGGTRGTLSTRRKFPQVSADLSVRWCSSYLKIDNAKRALCNQERFRGKRTLFLTGERAQESPGRANYPKMEVDMSDARQGRLKRHIDRWRPVHGWDEAEVWAILKRWKINPHPAYLLGWGRCSCSACIFGSANQFASLQKIYVEQFNTIADYEVELGRTVRRDMSIRDWAAQGTPYNMKPEDIALALSEIYYAPIVVDTWELPAGAFAESNGPV